MSKETRMHFWCIVLTSVHETRRKPKRPATAYQTKLRFYFTLFAGFLIGDVTEAILSLDFSKMKCLCRCLTLKCHRHPVPVGKKVLGFFFCSKRRSCTLSCLRFGHTHLQVDRVKRFDETDFITTRPLSLRVRCFEQKQFLASALCVTAAMIGTRFTPVLCLVTPMCFSLYRRLVFEVTHRRDGSISNGNFACV